MVRLADPSALRAHLARFDLARVPRERLAPVDAMRLDRLLDEPYDDLDGRDVSLALDLLSKGGLHVPLFAYFLPAALRSPPAKDPTAAERFLEGLIATRSDAAAADWAPEVDAVLEQWLATRPFRGGDDPVDLWISEEAAQRRELEAARRHPVGARSRLRSSDRWAAAWEGPVYARIALLLLQRSGARARTRLESWERAVARALAPAWVATLFHAPGGRWRPKAPGVPEFLDAPERAAKARALLAHPKDDVAVGAAAVLSVLGAGDSGARAAVEARVRTLDASESDRFVLTRRVRALLIDA